MQSPGDVLLIFDCVPLPHNNEGESEALMIEAGMVSSPSTKQLLGICASPPPSGQLAMGSGQDTGVGGGSSGTMTESLCRVLDGKFRGRKVSVQGVCSNIREDLRGVGGRGGEVAFGVFVSQLGGGQLGDICLPCFADGE